MRAHEAAVFRFGDFTLVPSERLLIHSGESIPLAGKAFDLLAALVRNAGHLLTKDELLAQVWPGVVVEEVNLSVNMSAIRKVLARSPSTSNWIETVPRQGYRFNAPVDVGDVATLDLAQLRGLGASYRGDIDPGDSHAPSIRLRWRAWLIAAVALLGIALAGGYRLLESAPPYPSVAVLPFAVDAPANAYLADGLVEAVINGLTLVRTLRVTPRASAFQFRAGSSDPIAAGRRLAAAAVVTGSLSLDGDEVRLQVDVVDVASGAQVWSEAYRFASAELPRLHARVLQDVLAAMRLPLERREGAAVERLPTSDKAAYLEFLQGRFHWNQRSEAAINRSIEHFRRAIELDPGFALAYAALADAHTALGYLSYVAPAGSFPLARSYAMKSLELDPNLGQAHAALAYIRFYFDWDWRGARDEFERAIRLNPNDPISHQWHAVYLLAAGRADEGFREIQIAQRLDPMSLAINTDVGFHHYYTARYEDAIAQLQAVLGMKDFMPAHLWLARSYLELGRIDESLAASRAAERVARDWVVLIAQRGFTLGVARRTEEAHGVLRQLDELAKQRFVTAYGVALVKAGLGEKDEAFKWLEKAFEERSHWLVWLRLDPRWKGLRGDPRFAAMVERLGYPAI